MVREAISWQFLVKNQLGGTLDSGNLGKYDQLVQACLATGAYCMIDIHNFARWNGGIIGQGGPTDDQFVSLWTQLASKYAKSERVVFELMNEPHDLDVNIWAATCQKVVTAIRNAGATSQMILLPGTNFDSAATLVSSGSADVLINITNPDGSTKNLLLDVHKYLDEDNSGTHAACVTDNVDSFRTVAGVSTRARSPGYRERDRRKRRCVMPHGLLRPELFYQCELGRICWVGGMGRGEFQHRIPPELDTHQERKRVGGRQACVAVCGWDMAGFE